MALKAVFFAALTVTAIGGCTTGAEFETRPYDLEFKSAKNYQAVYAGVLAGMRGCWAGQSIMLSVSRVEGQLYPELGYGEIYHGEAAMIPVHHSSTRIDRAGSGSIIRVRFAQPGKDGGATYRGWLEHWAAGGRSCPRVGALTAPKAS